ncbi:hypothetical protein MMC10_011441 [Thelotrema lepadinum]|nr:hypothetical protein [Thelotrema lepadinum]
MALQAGNTHDIVLSTPAEIEPASFLFTFTGIPTSTNTHTNLGNLYSHPSNDILQQPPLAKRRCPDKGKENFTNAAKKALAIENKVSAMSAVGVATDKIKAAPVGLGVRNVSIKDRMKKGGAASKKARVGPKRL